MTNNDVGSTEIEDAAREYYEQKKYKEVLKLYEEAESSGSVSGQLVAAKSAALLRLRKYAEVIRFLESKLPEHPESWQLHHNLAIAYQVKSKHLAARKEFKTARSLDDSPEQFASKGIRRFRIYRYSVYAILITWIVLVAVFWPKSRYFIIPLVLLVVAAELRMFILGIKNREVVEIIGWFLFLLLTVLIGLVVFAAIFLSSPDQTLVEHEDRLNIETAKPIDWSTVDTSRANPCGTTALWVKMFYEEDLDAVWDMYSENVKKVHVSRDEFKVKCLAEEKDGESPSPIVKLEIETVYETSSVAYVQCYVEQMPSETSMTGFETQVRLVKEDGLWSIDDAIMLML